MAAGFPGTFPGSNTTGFLVIGAVQKQSSSAAGFPGTFPGGLTVSYLTIGAVQKQAGVAHTLSISDSITFSEALSDQPQVAKTDAVTFADALASQTGKSLSDALAFLDAHISLSGKGFTDSITFADDGTKSFGKSIADALVLADTVSAGIVGVLTLSVSDTVTFSDSVTTILTAGPIVCPPDKYRRRPLGWMTGTGEHNAFAEIDCEENKRKSLGFIAPNDTRKPFSQD